MTRWPCASSACRSMARSESLSSTSRIGKSIVVRVGVIRGSELKCGWRRRCAVRESSPEPAGRHARAASFFLEVGERLFVVDDLLLQPVQLIEGLLAVSADDPLF